MNNKFIKQYGTEILSYRLRTARQKTRLQYEDFDKQLIQLGKERNLLWQQQRNLGWMPLIPPVQRGFKRTFVLRNDLARSKLAELYTSVLEKVNNIQYSSSKHFKKKKRKFGRKSYVDRSQFLSKIGSCCFEKMGLSDAEKQCFYELWETNNNKQLVKYHAIAEPWRFVLKVMPNMIVKTRIKDYVLEARVAEIADYLERNNYNKRLNKLLDGNCYSYWKRDKELRYADLFKNKSKTAMFDLIKEELIEKLMSQ